MDPYKDPDAANESEVRSQRLIGNVQLILEAMYNSKEYVPQ